MEISEHEANQLISLAEAARPLIIAFGQRIYVEDSLVNRWALNLVRDWRQEHSYGRGE